MSYILLDVGYMHDVLVTCMYDVSRDSVEYISPVRSIPLSNAQSRHKSGAMAVPLVTLSSGRAMPVIGFGTGGHNLPADRLVEVLLDAVEAGYRHFDTASLYGSEPALGRVVAEAIRRGLVPSREDLFVTSKLWCADADPDLVLPALERTLSNLGLEYVDLFLIHWPVRMKPERTTMPPKPDDFLPFDGRATWAAMEECQRLGLARSVGVSNFSIKKLSDLLDHAAIPPAVNQVELNPAWDQRRLRAFCKERGVHITAYSPLGANGAPWGSPSVMQSPVLKEIAAARGKSLPNVALRWAYEQGVSLVVRSSNKDRMKDNLRIFDWELSEEDRHKITQIPQQRVVRGDTLVPPEGSVEELWDGEL